MRISDWSSDVCSSDLHRPWGLRGRGAGHTIFLARNEKYKHQELSMSVSINALTDAFSVAPQLFPEDMQAVADAGFKSVIISRPDLEGGPQQPLSADVMAAARAAGLAVEYQQNGNAAWRGRGGGD